MNLRKLTNGWYDGTIGDYCWQAKVFDVGSEHGIGGGRISKLWINGPNGCVYNYDRGLDFDAAPAHIVESIVALFQTI